MLARDPVVTPEAALAGVGPRPQGDPAGMRALAAQLRAVAGELGGQGHVSLANWESPRGRAVRARLAAASATAGRTSHEVGHLASLLETAASDVEGQLASWNARRAAALAHLGGRP
jgi:hypothetical protein